jgi:glycosyltransferase involved in cell wall biosynthesis
LTLSTPDAAPAAGPRVSVVMTVYRDFRFLDEAVDSVLAQTYRDLELIIVDDGNRNDPLFEGLARRDPRIRTVISPENIGTAAAANLGVAAARGEIIARLDADDIAEPARIGALVAALDADPDLGLVGSSVMLIEEMGRPVQLQPMPETDLDIRWTILFHNPFYHSAVAFRREWFEAAGRYRIEELVSQDHYLWFDMMPHCRARNLPEPLIRYRLNSAGLTVMNSTNNPRGRTHKIREAEWARIGLAYDLHDNARAGSITAFLRGQDIPLEQRATAYPAILNVLIVFLAARRPFVRPEDKRSARRLVRDMIDRMTSRPPKMADMRALRRLFWKLSPVATIRSSLRPSQQEPG